VCLILFKKQGWKKKQENVEKFTPTVTFVPTVKKNQLPKKRKFE
jgi:hypothetical protein